MREATLEERAIGQHTDAGGAVLLVGAGDGDRVEVGAEDARRGRRFLDLAEEAHFTGPIQSGAKVPHRHGVAEPPFEDLLGNCRPGFGEFLPLACNDLVKDRAHSLSCKVSVVYRFASSRGEATMTVGSVTSFGLRTRRYRR